MSRVEPNLSELGSSSTQTIFSARVHSFKVAIGQSLQSHLYLMISTSLPCLQSLSLYINYCITCHTPNLFNTMQKSNI